MAKKTGGASRANAKARAPKAKAAVKTDAHEQATRKGVQPTPLTQRPGHKTCALCGEPIPRQAADPLDGLSMDHVPPRQFYPAEVRAAENPNLWTVPTHRRCNGSFRNDEEYFYHALYGIVLDHNPRMAAIVGHDLERRTHKPQTPAMMRSILKTHTTITDGGIILPAGVVQYKIDEYQLQRVAIKIAQGLLYRELSRYFARESCCDIRLCLELTDVPEMYRISWAASQPPRGKGLIAVLPAVFSYHVFELEAVITLSMLFWESLMFCAVFDGLAVGKASEAVVKARLQKRLGQPNVAAAS